MRGFTVCWPTRSTEGDLFGRLTYSYSGWPDGRISDCRINGRPVSPMAFRKFQHDLKRRPNKMTPDRLRWNLMRYTGERK